MTEVQPIGGTAMSANATVLLSVTLFLSVPGLVLWLLNVTESQRVFPLPAWAHVLGVFWGATVISAGLLEYGENILQAEHLLPPLTSEWARSLIVIALMLAGLLYGGPSLVTLRARIKRLDL